MPAQEKVELREKYLSILKERPNFILTRYHGLSVAQMENLRGKLKKQGSYYTVVKNNIFRLALKEVGLLDKCPLDSTLVGPLAVVFSAGELPQAAKILKDFKKENDALSIVGGVMETTYYDAMGVEALAGLPSREELLAKLAATINAPASQIAGVVQNIIASLARAIKAVGEKNG
ncbi:MAG: 50S ribosomal protein L10 [Leptospiraceae bacterium]|nr:50S ribosomal protein L10 [Leptospiraceae bacterium]MDW8305576.1 50S ribosomal protein L10 [Leptospiraceae bacterium]